VFKINNVEVAAKITKITRSIKKTYKYEVTTEDGKRHAEVKGLYRVYNVMLGNISQTDYDSLRAQLSGYTEVFSVTLPDGQTDVTFNAKIDISQDAIGFIEGLTYRWDGLVLTITATEPLARA